jgi:molecular chaperone GrpE
MVDDRHNYPADDAEGTATDSPVPADEITRLRQELQESRDRSLRTVAEMQNQQRRAQRDREEALKFAESQFAKELLVVLDGLERAREAAASATDVAPVAEGVRIVYDQFLKILGDHHIEPIDAVGQPFDPTFHEAVMQQPSRDHPAETVLQQLARGYQMHGRVLRPAKVIVSKAG